MKFCSYCDTRLRADRYVGLLCPNCGHVESDSSVRNSTISKSPIEYETRPQPFDDEQFKKLPGRNILERTQIANYFPAKFTPRNIQIELWNEIQSKFASGYKIIVLSAPPGVGKSLLAASVANQLGSSFIVTSTKSLQDQYTKDLPNFYSVKGKSNFACYQIMEKKQIPFSDSETAISKGFTCNVGKCVETVIENGKEKKVPCKFKPKIEELKSNSEKSDSCLYYTQKYRGLISPHSIWSYSSYFQILEQKETFEDYLDRSVAIFDEAHKIEDQIIQFIGINITKTWVEECNLNIKHYDLTDIDMILTLLEDLSKSYAGQIKSIKDQNPNSPDYERMGKLEEKYVRIMTGINWISSYKKNFVINDPQKDKKGEFKSISIQPLFISYYVNKYFQNPFQIFMSATIDKQSFCENLGFAADTVAFIDTPKSPFKPENRKIKFENVVRLNYQSQPHEILAAINRIDQIMSMYTNQRGIIFTSSKKRCFDIEEKVSPENKKRIRIWHSTDSKSKTMKQLLQEHHNSKNGVLLSSSLWEGIDLKDDLSRFQIVEKTPYADLSNKRIRIKKSIVPHWYESMALVKLLQGFGRSVRNENDWAVTHVIDSGAEKLLNRMKDRVPKAYYDVLGWS